MPRGERLGPALLLLLLALSLATALAVLNARTPDLALEVLSMSRQLGGDGDEEADEARLRFFVRFDEPNATIQIVGRDREPIRTLADGYVLNRDEVIRCIWDGRDDAGEHVPRGRYRLRVVLPGQGRDMVFPRRIKVAQVDRVEGYGELYPCSRVGPRP